MRISVVLALSLVMSGLAAAVSAQEPEVIRGTVVDDGGRPVPNVFVGNYWAFADGRLRPSASSEFPEEKDRVTAKDGVFSMRIVASSRGFPVIAIDEGGHRGGMISVDPKRIDEPLRITLTPLCSVRGRVDLSRVRDLPLRFGTTTQPVSQFDIAVVAVGRGVQWSQIARIPLSDGFFTIDLPRGEYDLLPSGAYSRCEAKRIECREAAIDVGTVTLEPNPLTPGKPPPDWTLTAAKGIPPSAKLGDFLGKIVVVEFWGVGCGPCVTGNLPKLMDFAERHSDQRDRFVILAFHDPQIRSFDELAPYLERFKAKHWGGRDLPFPILLDTTGATERAWGIVGYPTNVILDAEGRFVDISYSHHDVERVLEILLKSEQKLP